MTIKELIAGLGCFDENTPVVLPGYEEGFNDVGEITLTRLVDHPRPRWYVGVYDREDYYEEMRGKGKAAVLLTRFRPPHD